MKSFIVSGLTFLMCLSPSLAEAECQNWPPEKRGVELVNNKHFENLGATLSRKIPASAMNTLGPNCWRWFLSTKRSDHAASLAKWGSVTLGTLFHSRGSYRGGRASVIRFIGYPTPYSAEQSHAQARTNIRDIAKIFADNGTLTSGFVPEFKDTVRTFKLPDYGTVTVSIAYFNVDAANFRPGQLWPSETRTMASMSAHTRVPASGLPEIKSWQIISEYQPFLSEIDAIEQLGKQAISLLEVWSFSNSVKPEATAAAASRLSDGGIALQGQCARAYRKFKVNQSTFRAFALSQDNEWCGWAHGELSQIDVDERALGFCRQADCRIVFQN